MTAGTPSVLVAFRARNVRSFRDELELSLLATSVSEQGVPRDVPWRMGGRPIGVLPAAGVFGANASGKTSVLRAMADMRFQVLHSFRHAEPTGGIANYRPFLLDLETRTMPSSFEIDLILDGVRHEYGFRIDTEHVVEEWAYRYPKGRPALLFHRDRDVMEFGSTERSLGRRVQALLRANALFLSTAASANHPSLLPLYQWFDRNLLFAQAESRGSRQRFTAELLDSEETRDQVLGLLRAADLGITGASRRELDAALLQRFRKAAEIIVGPDVDLEDVEPPVELADFEVRLKHKSAEGEIELEPWDESYGTMVWFGLVGPVMATLRDGAVLLADELDASLHPVLVQQLVRLFQNQQTNPRRAQLIFNSHDVTVLGSTAREKLLGRDQIWFTEKRDDGSTRLYALADLGPRKDEPLARRYLAGRYGAIPIVSKKEFEHTAEMIASSDHE